MIIMMLVTFIELSPLPIHSRRLPRDPSLRFTYRVIEDAVKEEEGIPVLRLRTTQECTQVMEHGTVLPPQ